MVRGVLLLPWHWRIPSILLQQTGRGTSTKTCGLSHIFPPYSRKLISCLIYIFRIFDVSQVMWLNNEERGLILVLLYNMVGSALFLLRALYTVHCTNTMHSRKPSFATTPAVFSQHCKSLFCNICGNGIRHILLKQFHLITFDINTIKHPCISPCT